MKPPGLLHKIPDLMLMSEKGALTQHSASRMRFLPVGVSSGAHGLTMSKRFRGFCLTTSLPRCLMLCAVGSEAP